MACSKKKIKYVLMGFNTFTMIISVFDIAVALVFQIMQTENDSELGYLIVTAGHISLTLFGIVILIIACFGIWVVIGEHGTGVYIVYAGVLILASNFFIGYVLLFATMGVSGYLKFKSNLVMGLLAYFATVGSCYTCSILVIVFLRYLQDDKDQGRIISGGK